MKLVPSGAPTINFAPIAAKSEATAATTPATRVRPSAQLLRADAARTADHERDVGVLADEAILMSRRGRLHAYHIHFMKRFTQYLKEKMKDPVYKKHYDALETEFIIIESIIRKQLAKRKKLT